MRDSIWSAKSYIQCKLLLFLIVMEALSKM